MKLFINEKWNPVTLNIEYFKTGKINKQSC